MSYTDFAYCYDLLMSDVDYPVRTEYILSLFKRYGKAPTLLLDLACGTGAFSNLFAERGIEVIGVDMSEDMLSVARENSANVGLDVLYLCQSAQELDLYGTVDGAVCCMDSLNHITDITDLEKAIAKVSLFLEPDCLFIFDLNTEYKHREILGNNTFVIDENEVYCVWQNSFDEKSLTTDISLDFFIAEDDCYYRSCEEFSERAYTQDEISQILKAAGLETVGIFDDMTENPPTDMSERVIYVTRKI